MMQRMFHVVCDNCFEQVDGDEWYSAQARARAKAEGFIRRGNRDLCPDCAVRHDV